MVKYLVFLGLLVASTAFAVVTVSHIGKSCQICIINDNIKVCKYHEKCPIQPEKKDK